MQSLTAPTPLDILAPAACVCFDEPDACMCRPAERALRHVIRTHGRMNGDQREWCLREIDRVEGHGRHDFIGADDATVAGGVFSAWTDYCRDKGLI
jgi:hypothetical protein